MLHKNKIVSWIIVIICVIAIYFFSNMDTNKSNSKSKMTINNIIDKTLEITNFLGITDKQLNDKEKRELIEKLNLPARKVAHVTEYCILAICILIALTKINPKTQIKFIIAISICFIYACFDEYHQTFVKGRTGQFSDSLIDLLGGLFGCFIYELISLIKKKRLLRKSIKSK